MELRGRARRARGRIAAASCLEVMGVDGPRDLQSLRLYGPARASPAVRNGVPLLPQPGRRNPAAAVSWNVLP
jgi:hypothetical protein